jgi:hypothetical protein
MLNMAIRLKIAQLFHRWVRGERHSMTSSTAWWQLDAETLRSVADLPDWDSLLHFDVDPSWQEQQEEEILRRSDPFAQIIKYIWLVNQL